MKIFDSDDRSIELPHVLGALGVLVFLFLATWQVVKRDKDFDMTGFGLGLGTVFAATGIASIAQGTQRRIQDGGQTTSSTTTTTATVTAQPTAPPVQ